MIGFLIDLDGTLYSGHNPIPEAYEFISLLKQKKLPFLLLTNNSSRLPQEVAAHLLEVTGIEVTVDEIFTSAQAATLYIADQQQHASVYCIGEQGLLSTLEVAGFTLTNNSASTQPDFVVQGIDRQFTYEKLERAVQYIAAGAISINTNPDHLLPSSGRPHPGSGSLAAAIATASQVQPIVIGKPSSIIMNYAIERLGLPAADIWVVGDNVHTDINGGKLVGCPTALVLTGLATLHNVQQQIDSSQIQPDLVCTNLKMLAEKLRIY
ncbi:HAD-IIA family hydrolase [Paenibacillus psychroresistens]|uniref:Acid sugar phosphatase n=1 Tax=Paenibacillus psychroresistens TaxID=1778678 RepID=A0A6B8RFZ7_9BACL|nr:HAD-IIA family hydrolase [Paenibacillus psychroresistens]QGQ94867.1 HAD-IIA family hydrolase [Paenibacillus psychroresistens]